MLKRLILGALLTLCCVFNATALIPFDPSTSTCDETTFGTIIDGRAAMEPIWVPEIIAPCEAGTYLPANEISCEICTENHYCPGSAETTISDTDQGIQECDSDLYSSLGASTAAECCPSGTSWSNQEQRCIYDPVSGDDNFVCESTKWLHIGSGEDDKACLATDKPANGPSLAIKLGNETLYLYLTEEPTFPIHRGTTKKLRIEYNGKIYNAHDGSIIQNHNSVQDSPDPTQNEDTINTDNSGVSSHLYFLYV